LTQGIPPSKKPNKPIFFTEIGEKHKPLPDGEHIMRIPSFEKVGRNLAGKPRIKVVDLQNTKLAEQKLTPQKQAEINRLLEQKRLARKSGKQD